MDKLLRMQNRMPGNAGDLKQPTNSAQLAKAEREIKELRQENEILKKNFDEINSLYRQLIAESDHENYDRWRVTLLKSQLIQLERQIMLLTDALSRRSMIVLDVENSLTLAIDLCRSVLADNDRTSVVKLSRLDFERLIQMIESSRAKLFKNSEATCVDNTKRPLHTWNPFIRNDRSEMGAVSLIDLCSGSCDHVNIQHVSFLETSLMELYRQLKLLAATLPNFGTVYDVPGPARERLAAQMATACNTLQKTNQQLLQLSVLVPSAPTPAPGNSSTKPLNLEDVLKVFQSCLKGQTRQKDLRRLVGALLKAVNYSVSMAEAEKTLLIDELKFHHAIYDIQSDHVTSLLTSIKEEYGHFEEDLQTMICKPLKEILNSFKILKESTTDRAVQAFFKVLKDHEPQLSETVEKFSSDKENMQEKEGLLSEYGQHFTEKLSSARSKWNSERDQRIDAIDLLRAEREDHLMELGKLFPGSSWTSKNSTLSAEQDGPSSFNPDAGDSDVSIQICRTNLNSGGDGFHQEHSGFMSSVKKTNNHSIAKSQVSTEPNDNLASQSRTCDSSLMNRSERDGACTCDSVPGNATTHQSSSSFATEFSDSCVLHEKSPLVQSNMPNRKKTSNARKEPRVALSKLRLKQSSKNSLSSENSSENKVQD